jgi:site-specific DNA-methyltransferase (adenine-specific)
MATSLQVKEGGPIQIGNFKIQQRGLIATGKPTYDEWYQVGEYLRYLEGSLMWAIGDWLNYGEQKYGEMYAQAVEETGKSYQTVANAKWVANQFSSAARKFNVSWELYHAVASQPDGIRNELLAQAEQEGWTRKQLRKAIQTRKLADAIVDKDCPLESECWKLYQGDFAAVANQIQNDSIDAIITDPPYPKEFLPVFEVLAREAARILKPGASLVVMSGQYHLPEVIEMMARHMRYQWTLAYLTPGGQAPQIFQRNVNTFWKPVLWFVKGDYDGPWIGDVCKSEVNDNDKRFHEWGQSESGMVGLVERFSKPNDIVLDPFCGGGTTGVVSIKLGRRFIGVDLDESSIKITGARINAIANETSPA